MTYKNFVVNEVILHDYQYPETAILINAPSGCPECNSKGVVQPGHSQCDIIPKSLIGDDKIFPRLEQGWGWILEYIGNNKSVDEWLPDEIEESALSLVSHYGINELDSTSGQARGFICQGWAYQLVAQFGISYISALRYITKACQRKRRYK